MAGRPPKDNSRDKQYRVRLNDEEDSMLSYVCSLTGKQKSEIFRNALEDYYHKIRIQETNQDEQYDEDWDTGHISLKRIIDCPYCKAKNRCDFEDECDVCEDEDRPMGSEITYSFDWHNYTCCSCGKDMHIYGYICEYPVGAYNYEDISVEEEE